VPNRSGRSIDSCTFDSKPIETYGPAIADIAGGFTASQAIGGWKDNHGQLIVEPVTVFDCTMDLPHGNGNRVQDDAWRIVHELWFNLAKRIAEELNQDCVYLSFDGKVEFVTK
jgi:hypothetical protein